MTNEQLLIQISKLYNSYADGGIGSLDECQESILALIQQFRESCQSERVMTDYFESLDKMQTALSDINQIGAITEFEKRMYAIAKKLGGKSDILSLLGSYKDTTPDEEVIEGIDIWLNAHFEKGKQ